MSLNVFERNNLIPQKSISDTRSTTPTPADPHSLRNQLHSLDSISTPNLNQLNQIEEVSIDSLVEPVSPTLKEGVFSNFNEGKFKSGKGFTKKLFNWGSNKDKKINLSGGIKGLPTRQISSPIPISLPPSNFTATTSLPLGFPSPPSSIPDLTSPRHFIPPSQRMNNSYTPPQHHPTAFIAPHLAHPGSQSLSSMSSMTSTSSFNTTYTTDDWDSSSEITSFSTTPDISPQQRMWRVKGLEEEITCVEDDEILQGGGDRNSTPVPRERPLSSRLSPSTPPRAKRYSASSTISHSSPPFDLEYEKAAKALRNSTSFLSPPESPSRDGDNEDADDEISPPKKFKSRKNHDHLFASSHDEYNSRVRIPSIRFEGISMDAVFAQVERKMRGEEDPIDLSKEIMPLGLGYSIPPTKELSFKRQPLSVTTSTRPSSYPSRSESQPSPTDSRSSRSSTDSTHTTKGVSTAMGHSNSLPITSTHTPILIKPSPYSRRLSSRPTPLNVLAANSLSSRNTNNYSPKRYHSAPLVPQLLPTTPLPPSTPKITTSPILAGAFSSSTNTPTSTWNNNITYSPASYSPNSPFMSETYTPSPTNHSVPVFKAVIDLPEVSLMPPSPSTPDNEFWDPTSRPSSSCSTTTTTTSTKVVLLEKGKTVKKVSSRAPTFRKSSLDSNRKLSLISNSSTSDDISTLSPSTSSTSTPPLSPTTSNHSILTTPSPSLESTSKFVQPLQIRPTTITTPLVQSTIPINSNKVDKADEALRMLLHLNSPLNVIKHIDDQPQTFSLTSGALQLHNSPGGRKYKENKRINSSLSINSMVVVDDDNLMYESDDSSGQFGDAPHHLTVAKQPTIIVPTLTLSSNLNHSSDAPSKRPPVPHRADQIHAFLMEQERDLTNLNLPISKVLLTLTPSSSTSSTSPSMHSNFSYRSRIINTSGISSSNRLDSNKSFDSNHSSTSMSSISTSSIRGHSRMGSTSSSISTKSSSINGGLLHRRGLSNGSGKGSLLGGLVRSADSMMSLNESCDSEEYDSVEGHGDNAVVMMGERVSYQSGAVGVAM